ncbi:MAG TPA: hypothetical protein VFI31_08735 [Pirellulales bacterium]|nr:hypothetical protein [Pirellulales bacterium]
MIPRPAPLTDSPWFWLLLFGSVGLVMLTAVEPKFAKRQERIERMHQSRQPGRQAGADPAEARERAETPFWQPTRQATLRPLMLFLAGVLVAGVVAMQIRRQAAMADFRQALAAESEASKTKGGKP